MTFTAQELNHLIEFQAATLTQDAETGAMTETWATVASAYARIDPLVGREFFAAAATQSENTVKFTMRFRSDLNPAMRLIHDGDAWNMTSIINVKGRNRETLIMAKRIE